MEVENSKQAEPGDQVILEIQDPEISRSAFYVYIIPLIVMVVGVLVGLQIGRNAGFDGAAEFISVATGLVFLVFSYILLGVLDKRKKDSRRDTLRMVEVVKNKGSGKRL